VADECLILVCKVSKLFSYFLYISLSFLYATSAKAEEAAVNTLPDEGIYISEGGHDVLKIKNTPSAKVFNLFSMSGNGHVCEFDGKILFSGKMTVDGDEDYPPEEQCVLNPQFNDQGIDLRRSSEHCDKYCGARADFRDYYLRVSKECTPEYIDIAISNYENASQIEKKAFIEKNIMPILSQCSKTLSNTQKDKINLVMAMSHYYAGNKKACLETLSIYDESEELGPSVTDTDLMEELMKKVIYIRGLCK
jgi:hypothetical protein